MAFPPLLLNQSTYCSSACKYTPYNSLNLVLPQPRSYCFNNFTALKFRVYCSNNKGVQIETQQQPRLIKVAIETTKKKRKLKPSFLEQVQNKWSMKMGSPRDKFPWQEEPRIREHQEEEEEEEEEEEVEVEVEGSRKSSGNSEFEEEDYASETVSFGRPSNAILAPWVHGTKPFKPQVDSEPESSTNSDLIGEYSDGFSGNSDNERLGSFEEAEIDGNNGIVSKFDAEDGEFSNGDLKEKIKTTNIGINGVIWFESSSGKNIYGVNLEDYDVSSSDSAGLPWKREEKLNFGEGQKGNLRKRSNILLAERVLPEHELQRLRNISLRMVERTKVGAIGITQALVDQIHQKWKLDEVVKLKFEEPLSLNMKRTHEVLENRTGGMVIWRSGSLVVLYRGMSYNLPCVKSFIEEKKTITDKFLEPKDVTNNPGQNQGAKDTVETMQSLIHDSAKTFKDPPKEEVNLSDLNHLLDELGPRFKDWMGAEPLPVDADLLSPLVPGYRTPFRLLPHGTRHSLRNHEMTKFRRLARIMPPHFALGRNRELQGLAKAMVKLWEKSAIAKIAIKRGVPNTSNDRMAEELKKLTGGTLISRNKEFIVFYRGNDFLPPVVTKTLKERRQVRDLQQDEEERARQTASAFIESKVKTSDQLVAGTLAETKAATAHWGNQHSSVDVVKMMRDATLAKHESLIRNLENKLALAKGKFRKAERALAKVQEDLEPTKLPDDSETLTDEERFLFRKIGLSMKPYMPLGRRGVYDGTIQNMHLHWKFRELVKIIVSGKSFEQLKHIAIDLEAESGGVLVSLDKTTKGYAIVVYRGKNYKCPAKLKPGNLLTRRQAWARSIELQRREALLHHVTDLKEKIDLLKSELEESKREKMIDDKDLHIPG